MPTVKKHAKQPGDIASLLSYNDLNSVREGVGGGDVIYFLDAHHTSFRLSLLCNNNQWDAWK